MTKADLLIWAAWILQLASWFLPGVKPQDFAGAVAGWQAFRLAACAIWPCEGVQFQTAHHAVYSNFGFSRAGFNAALLSAFPVCYVCQYASSQATG